MNGLGLWVGMGVGEENFQSQWEFLTMRLCLSSVLFVSCTRSWLRIFLVTLRIKLPLVFTLINFTLKMEAGFSSETLKSASKTTRLINPEVYTLTPNRVDNTKNRITLPLEFASQDVKVLQAVNLLLTSTRSAHFLFFLPSSLYTASLQTVCSITIIQSVNTCRYFSIGRTSICRGSIDTEWRSSCTCLQ